MKPKKRIKPEHATAHLLIAAGRFANQWPDKGELERIGVAEAGRYPSVTSPDILRALISMAVCPHEASRDGFFASLYERAPDFVLALLAHLREVNGKAGKASPIRKFLQTVPTFEEDGKLVAVADASDAQVRAAILRHIGRKDGITEDAVKMQRQRMVKLSKPLAAHNKARNAFARQMQAILRQHKASDPSNQAFPFSPAAPYSTIGYFQRNTKR